MKKPIEVRETKKLGRGIFATRNIKKGEVVDTCPVVAFDSWEVNDMKLRLYVFSWTSNQSAVALGLGSLFNHSKRSNVTYNPVHQEQNMIFVARKNIKKGHQLFIDYGYDPKYGIESTERNHFLKLKRKFEPHVSSGPLGESKQGEIGFSRDEKEPRMQEEEKQDDVKEYRTPGK